MALPRIGLTFRADPLLWVQDIEAFDGPILSEYRDADGSVYLEKWCAHDAATRTTRVLRVTSRHRAIAEYLGGRCSMRELLTRPNHNAGMLVDADSTGIVGAALVDVAALPPEYLPDVDAMHDESLRPTTAKLEEALRRALHGEAMTNNETEDGEAMTNNETEEAYRHKYSVLETATGLLAEARQNGSPGWSEEEVRAREEWLRWRVEEGWTSSYWPRYAGEQFQVDESVRAYARAVLVVEALVRFHAEHGAAGYRDNARRVDPEVEALRARVAELEAQLAANNALRVRLWQPNEDALAKGLVVGATVRLPNGDPDVVVAYDHAGDPVVQGDGNDSFYSYYAADLTLVLPPEEV
jgi:hypothetical protein